MTIRISCADPTDERRVKEALVLLANVTGPVEKERALHALSAMKWWVWEYKHEVPEPERIPAGEHTLRDLHSICNDVLVKQGYKMMLALFDKYRLSNLADLPAGLYNEFYTDARTTFNTVVSHETQNGEVG